jgi:polyisoprenoid-binding protein YceI
MKKLSLRAVAVAAAFAGSVLVSSVCAVAAESPVAVKDGKAVLTPENTRVQFVCAHRGPKPDPRVGTFAKFTGTAEVDKASKELKGLSLDFDTNSLTTEFGKLTSHLKTADFFDTREHPKASFVSKKVVAGAKAGDYTVTGDLTLHGVTKSVKAPVTVAVSDAGVTLTSQFAIDRSEFGMNYGADKVENTVALTVVIGEKNKVFTEAK